MIEKKSSLINALINFVLVGILGVVTWFIYKSGLTGGFIFDDYHSLKKLSVLNGEITWQGLINYFGLSDTGPLKRPISIYSFIIDAQDWPAHPLPFKKTNILIHILNGALLYCLLKRVFSESIQYSRFQYFIAFVAAGIWLFHPFLVSTTLYIVQRMAMLPLTFMLFGLLLYTHVRVKCSDQPNLKQKMLLTIAVFGGTGLAMLSKENGVLFMLLVVLYEFMIVQNFLKVRALPKNTRLFLLYIPAVVLLVALAWKLPGYLERYDERDFNAFERQLTQFRVITDYIYHLLVPKYFTAGVFNDGFVTSQGLFQPIGTIFSIIFISALSILAWLVRKKYVWLSFAVFFYFIAQLLESTIIPLEMYFEHRNYVSAAFIGVPISLALCRLVKRSKIFYVVPIVLLMFLIFLTYLRVLVWSDNFKLHEMTMKKFPESKRAFTMTADFYARSGYHDFALMTISSAIKEHSNLEFKLNQLVLLCKDERLDNLFMENLLDAFEQEKFRVSDMAAFTSLYRKLLRDDCNLDKEKKYGLKLFEALKNNSFNSTEHSKMLIRAYGVYYELESGNDLKVVKMVKELIDIDRRYYDVFEMFDVMINKEKYHLVDELLVYLKEAYKKEFRYKPDFEFFEDKINVYQKIVDENKS